MGLFGQNKKSDPKQQVREWIRKLRQESRKVDRQIAGIQREEMKVKMQIKDAANKRDMDVCRVLAKSLVNSKKVVSKLQTSKAQINSVEMGIQQQLATMRMAGSVQKSVEVMKGMQSLVKLPEIAASMRELSREMIKAGIIEEMIDDTLESLEPEELEEEAQVEVDKILWELTAGELGRAPAVPAGSMTVETELEQTQKVQQQQKLETTTGVTEDLTAMKDRLEKLRS